MPSANVVYERVSKQLIEFVINPVLKEEGYSITNFHFAGDIDHPKHTLLSIKADNKQSIMPSGVLERIVKNGKEIVDKFNNKLTNRSGQLFDICLKDYEIFGEYSAPETAEQLFPSLAIEYSLKNAEKRLDEFKREIKNFGKSFEKI